MLVLSLINNNITKIYNLTLNVFLDGTMTNIWGLGVLPTLSFQGRVLHWSQCCSAQKTKPSEPYPSHLTDIVRFGSRQKIENRTWTGGWRERASKAAYSHLKHFGLFFFNLLKSNTKETEEERRKKQSVKFRHRESHWPIRRIPPSHFPANFSVRPPILPPSTGPSIATMPEETTSIDYVMEAASGPHFSGLRLDGLLSPPPSSSTSSSAPRTSFSTSSAQADSNSPKQPFVIGNFFSWFLLWGIWIFYVNELIYYRLRPWCSVDPALQVTTLSIWIEIVFWLLSCCC